ncbi:MAG: DUF2851 family protein [Chloroflexi bacterium]|nr:DUF2851 family protein [Chloroflexota bacterium]
MRKRIKSDPLPVERELGEAWRVAPAAGTLTTVEGEKVRVVYPGRPNAAAGPDFLDAVLETGDGEVRGAVELHRRTSDWERHGHGADPRYSGVVLHVVGRHDGAASRPPGGAQLPLLELVGGSWTGGEDAAPPLPCAANITTGRDPLPLLEAAGDARFEAGIRRIQELQNSFARPSGAAGAAAADWDQLAYVLLAEALGYSQNTTALHELAAAVPLDEVRRCAAGAQRQTAGTRAEALLLGAAGLLPSQRHLPAARCRGAYVEALERAWQVAGRAPALRSYRWDFAHVRPENAPVRRVVALAKLALEWPRAGVFAAIAEVIGAPDRPSQSSGGRGGRRNTPAEEPRPHERAKLHDSRRPDAGARVLLAANRNLARRVTLPCPEGYWAEHWDFGVPVKQPGTEATALIGHSRAADAVVNVLLPLAVAMAVSGGDAALHARAVAAYRTHPLLTENWITRLVRERTGLSAARGDRVAGARAQQGLIAIYEGPCRELRCGECPLGVQSEKCKMKNAK